MNQSAEASVLVLEKPPFESMTSGADAADVGIGEPSFDMEPIETPRKVKIAMLAAVIFPPIGVLISMVLLWGGLFNATDLILLASMYVLTGLGITIGYHRLCTHKAFATRKPVALFFVIFGSMAAQGPVIWWCATHRRHHQYSDQEFDPHSPHAARDPGIVGFCKGFAHSHIGWLFEKEQVDFKRYVPDLLADPMIMRLNNLFTPLLIAGLLLPALVSGLITMTWTGAALGLLWGGLVRIFLLHHATWSVNSVCHVWGKREFRSGDESRNNPFIGILALGEGWHNNHHAFPASARHGLKWWQFDLSWMVIRTLKGLGLVSKVRLPDKERMEARRRRA
ncbi:MAG: acyl-CoA desaturase [Planctomycetes bacterium]|nr:acyl-CoA desaturase [Planctomycetota bacterium]